MSSLGAEPWLPLLKPIEIILYKYTCLNFFVNLLRLKRTCHSRTTSEPVFKNPPTPEMTYTERVRMYKKFFVSKRFQSCVLNYAVDPVIGSRFSAVKLTP